MTTFGILFVQKRPLKDGHQNFVQNWTARVVNFNLKSVSIGDYCFKNQEVLNMTGLHTLERVTIGSSSFRKSSGRNSNRALYVKNCEELKELRMGPYSFSDYSVIEIENVDKLEVIEMGELNEESHNFYYASLELKSG